MSKIQQSRFIEIFMDIIYVYALMHSSIMLGDLTNGIIGPFAMFSYIFLMLIILAFRTYQITIDERYGSDSVLRIICKAVSGFLMLCCMGAMNGDWNEDFYPIVTILGILSLVFIVQYGFEFFVHHKDRHILPGHMGVMAVCTVFMFVSLMFPYRFGIICAALSICIPPTVSSLYKRYQMLPFSSVEPVLERTGRISILMIGMGIIRLLDYFTAQSFTAASIPLFIIYLAMIWFYVLEQDGLLDFNKVLKVPFNLYNFHTLSWIGAALITLVFNYMIHESVSGFFGVIVLYTGLLLYFGGIFALTIYNKRKMNLSIRMMYIYLGIYALALLFSAIFCSNSMVVMVLTCVMALLVTALFTLQKIVFQSRRQKK